MLTTLRLMLAAALGGMLAVQFAATALAADKVKIGTGGSASDAPFYIAQSKGFFKDEGLEVDLIVLNSAPR